MLDFFLKFDGGDCKTGSFKYTFYFTYMTDTFGGFFCLFIGLFANFFAHLLVFALFACFVFSFSRYKFAGHFIA